TLKEFFGITGTGKPATAELTFGGQKAVFAGYPVFTQNGRHHFGTVTVRTYYTLAQNVESALEEQRGFSVLVPAVIGAVAAGIAILILSWNANLEKLVGLRTRELRVANETLKAHDRLQREFINVAAHELRTPIQPLLGIAGILEGEIDGKASLQVSREDLHM